MGGGSTRAANVVKGLVSKGCDVTVVAAFPHYPHGKVPSQYRRKAIVSERFGAAKVFRVWVPPLASLSFVIVGFFMLSTAITLYAISRLSQKTNSAR